MKLPEQERRILSRQTLAIIGGTGTVGRHVAATAIEHGFSVRILARRPERVQLKSANAIIVEGNASDKAAIRSLLEGTDGVINAFGQPMRDKPIYSEVTKQVVEIMKEFGIRRYIGVTGGSLDIEGDRKSWMNRIGARLFRLFYGDMIRDKQRELDILRAYELDWTLVRLPFVHEGDVNKPVKVSPYDMPGMRISNHRIAQFLVDQIKDAAYLRQTPFISQ
ncbi:NAD(P)H-binding protein [Paenibacillus alvei]|uniref:NAD(P)H-binding protein n=1 Tax=Paenibacillus alvei TaxID=44250 RepID=A0AAP6ZT73_PAEAL|nr:NADH-flavin reductase [Paenibacillus alvei]MBG9747316.1 NADH-flavin reductase [Paenibacillus alvei]NOJ69431.1 NAD(P)H-binding protein [Paenibacillus alvei]